MSNLIFLKSRKFGNLRAVSHLENGFENLLPGKASQPFRNITFFPKKSNQKSMISAAKTQKPQEVQNCPQKASRSLQSRDMSN